MQKIKIKTPAKINLTLEALKKREDGYHEIRSVMQAVSLYDFLTISVEDNHNKANKINISGNSPLIPYNKANLVWIAADKFLQKADITNKKINIYVEKNIPVAAGLAGGSSNAAGTLYGLNKILESPLNKDELAEIASEIGSDVNFCLDGGTQLATSRGEILEKLSTPNLKIIIIKPKKLFISAKEAYEKYSKLDKNINNVNACEAMISAISGNNPEKIAKLLKNDLEAAILPDYPEITNIKSYLIENGCLNALMSGSGPSVFGIYNEFSGQNIPENEYYVVSTINHGANAAA